MSSEDRTGILRSRTLTKQGSAPQWAAALTPAPEALPDVAGAPVTVTRGEGFFSEGTAAAEVFRLVSGSARLVKLMNSGRRQICEFLMPGDFLGLTSDDEHQFSAEALEDSIALRFPRGVIEARITADADFAHDVRMRAAKGLNNAYDRMLFLCHRPATARVAWFLLSTRLQAAPGAPGTFHLPMTRADIGDYLGMALETASRAFTQLKRMGAIAEPDNHLVVVADRARLQDIAEHG